MSHQDDLARVIDAIDILSSDDFCEELDCEAAFRPERLSEREKTAHDKLSRIYRLAHGFNRRASCYHVHEKWRAELDEIDGREATPEAGGTPQ